ncbi:hypothetical protein [Brachybacterium sp. GPGPB12]|uniref:hypothetical protein n=1 Tax=Brachybacterium sp. GPGPB12 TaxID=3023517 RepID=UPI0031344692
MPTPTTRVKRSDASNHRAKNEGDWDVGAHDTPLWRVDTAAALRILFVPGSAAAHLAAMNAFALQHRKLRRRKATLFGALAGILVPALLAVIFIPLRSPLLYMLIVLALFSIFVFVYVRTVAMANIDDGSRFGRGEAGDQNRRAPSRRRHRPGGPCWERPRGGVCR